MFASQRCPKSPKVNVLSSMLGSGCHTKGRMLSLNAQNIASAFTPNRSVAAPLSTSNLRLAWAAKDTRFLSNRYAINGWVATLAKKVSASMVTRSRVTNSWRLSCQSRLRASVVLTYVRSLTGLVYVAPTMPMPVRKYWSRSLSP